MPGTILVVDDEKNIVQLARLYLNNEGFRVETAHDVTQMRDYIAALKKAHGDKPVMLVLQAWNWEPLNYGEKGYPTVRESRSLSSTT